LPAAVERTLAYDSEVLVEEFVEGREFTVGVVAGEALPVIEIRMSGPMFDYESKYQPGMAEEICPAPVEEEHALAMQRLAERVHRELKLGPFAYSRVDFRLTPDGRALCLEANVLPGMTPHSLIRLAAETAGITFPEFCDRIVGLALRRAGVG
jgi:D-alanine-D-alanine ligase